ncbi:putative GPI anchor-containing protein [Cryptosporidium hominis]
METKMNNLEIENCKSNESKSLECETSKENPPAPMKIVIPKSMIIFVSAATAISMFVLAFHVIPTLVVNKYLLFEQKGLPLRTDHRIFSFMKQSINTKPNNFRGNNDSPSNALELEFLKYGSSESIQSFSKNRKLSEAILNNTNSSLYTHENNTTYISGSTTLNFNSDINSVPNLGATETNSKFNSNYVCHKFVSISKSDSSTIENEFTHNTKCKTHYILARSLPRELNKLDLATINAFNHLSEASQSVKMIAEILDNKKKDEGLLILMASKMNYEPDWKSSLERIHTNWEFNTYVSQIILTSWTISKSFFPGRHYTPALDFGFMILNIPQDSDDELTSMKIRASLDVVKSFISNLNLIIDGTLSKLFSGPNYSILTENSLTQDLFTNWTYFDHSFSFLSNYFNKNQSMLLEDYLTSAALDVSRLIEQLPLTIVDSVILARDNLDNLYKRNPTELRYTNPNETQVVIIPPVERKKIAKYNYEEKFRRICIYQAHTEQRSILRSTPSRASMAEYARYHGYSYFLFDGSFYDSIPKPVITDWSKQGFYMKIFSGLKLLFWNLDKIGDIFGKIINDPETNLMSEKFYSEFLESVMPNYLNVDWDARHNARIGSTGKINSKGSSGKEGIQITPSNIKANVCDYIVWFDLDIVITNKFFSIERILDSNTPEYNNKPPEIFRNIYKDAGEVVFLAARDSEWRNRNSFVNSGFFILSRSRASLQTLFHTLALDPVKSQEVVLNGRFWPEQSTMAHATLSIFNHSFSSPNQTYPFLDTKIDTVNDIKKKFVGSTPVMLTAYLEEIDRYAHSVLASQRFANGFIHMSPDAYGDGPWHPGDLFVHAAGQYSPFRDNVLSGLLYSINTVGFTYDEINYFKNYCYNSLDFVYRGLDRLIEELTYEFIEFEKARLSDPTKQLENINNVDLTFHFVKKLMAVKTRPSSKDVLTHPNQTSYEKIHFLRCNYSLSMAAKWSIAEAFVLGGISVFGIAIIAFIFKFARFYSIK